ncbi:7575_t:CDS:2 [Cetraspora pellucida]|uniref:7575_t:CDS:1 n=1 Tax=Cetraspora pellucida TaxID=1433469 RepID=A0A9N9BW32_9GLOM|nr:7575_t:CDS:2 [Cetraspora pellucida]
MNPSPSLSVHKKDIQFLAQETTTLIVKNLPNLPESDLLKFLKNFGPQDIRLGRTQQLKNSAFLDFPDRALASTAYSKFQELDDIGGKKIRVEYASPSKEALKKKANGDSVNNSGDIKQNDTAVPHLPPPPPVPPIPGSQAEPIAPSLGFNYPPAPTLHYRYPPPTVEILYNIMNAIAAVPKLYTQVLHLMNKMNLPPPFKPVVPESVPPLLQQHLSDLQNTDDNSKKRKKRDELLSDDESEIDSEDEEQGDVRSKKKAKSTANVFSAIPLVLPIATTDNPYVNPLSTADSAFNLETNQLVSDSTFSLETNQSTADSALNLETNQTNPPEPLNCISIEDINSNKMPIEELQKIPAMKNYSAGDPTNTLYIKNLSQRKIEDKDLEYLFGRYFQSRSEMESQLGIQLLKGRMRGQAFIKLPSLEIATQALTEFHGYMLHNKPMIIQFSKGSAETNKSS